MSRGDNGLVVVVVVVIVIAVVACESKPALSHDGDASTQGERHDYNHRLFICPIYFSVKIIHFVLWWCNS